MSEWFPFLVIGVAAGSIYGLVALGLVLTYKTSGVFNLAQGALATAAAYIFYALHFDYNVNGVVAFIIAVPICGAVLGLAMERLAKALELTSMTLRVVATVGVLLIIEASCELIFGNYSRPVAAFMPARTLTILGARVTEDQLIIVAIVLACTLALYGFFRTARTGKAMRAVVDNPDLLALCGTNPVAVRRSAWVVGCVFAALSGVLLIEVLGQIDSTTITSLIVAAFAAAALARFQNLLVTYTGGLLVGLASSVASKLLQNAVPGSILSGLPTAMPFIILFLLMLVLPQGREILSSVKRSASLRWTVPWRIQAWALFAVGVLLISVPLWAGFHTGSWTAMLTFTLLFLSLGLLVRTAGLVCLCIVVFEAVAVVAFSKLVSGVGLPWLAGLVLAGLVAAAVAAMLAIPAVRLSSVFVAVASLGLGLLVQQMFYQTNLMFGTQPVGIPEPYPHLSWVNLSSTDGYYYTVLIIVACCCAAIVVITKTRLGRLLRALNDSPRTLATSGANVTHLRVLVFCLSGFFAGVAGTLFAVYVSVPTGLEFDPFMSLTYIALVVIAVGAEPWYALVSAAGFSLLQSYWNPSSLTYYLQLLFGISAIALAVSPGGVSLLPEPAKALIDRVGGRGRSGRPHLGLAGSYGGVGADHGHRLRRAPASLAGREVRTSRPSRAGVQPPNSRGVLQVQDIRVAFGGLVAVDGITLKTVPGTISGLIGPNGAGKTTMFNACSGLVRPTHGRVLLDGQNISRVRPAGRAVRGLGRTFQDIGLWDSMTVAQNIAMGREAMLAGQSAIRQMVGLPSERRTVAAVTEEAISLCGLRDLADEVVGTLPTGQRRLVEFARCLAGSSSVVLLDEPSSGLDQEETDRFGLMLRDAVRERNLGVLLVEHDMRLVMNVCSYVYVMDAGTLIFEGTPAEVGVSSAVRRAYLGEDEAGVLSEAEEHR